MLKTIQEKDLKGTVNLILKEFQLGKKIVVKVGSIMLILCLTSCSKDLSFDPATTVGNQVIKSMVKGNNGK
tara:strand:- start:485 stop:697 length:213 start_codon:yes stop_codon:yes gene_type:complete